MKILSLCAILDHIDSYAPAPYYKENSRKLILDRRKMLVTEAEKVHNDTKKADIESWESYVDSTCDRYVEQYLSSKANV